MNVKAVIFDLDNTLFDYLKMKKETTRAELKRKLFNHYLDYGVGY
jgi:FMN phosphatase YigB (HAD superfamily)